MRIHEDIMRVLTIKVDIHSEGPSIQISKREDRGDRRENRTTIFERKDTMATKPFFVVARFVLSLVKMRHKLIIKIQSYCKDIFLNAEKLYLVELQQYLQKTARTSHCHQES